MVNFHFMDLPPEIRNQIYTYLALSETNAQNNAHEQSPDMQKASSMASVYSPYIIKVQNLQHGTDSGKDAKYLTRTCYRLDPILWQLNRQIRAEARSLYLKRYLSVDVHGQLKSPYTSCPEQVGFRTFQHWWTTTSNREDTIHDVTTLEIRDFVDIVYPATKEFPCQADEYTGAGDESWPRFMAGLRIEIRDEGARLTVRTPLRMVEVQTTQMQRYFEGVAARKHEAGKRFDGRDIYAFVCWLRTNEDEEWDLLYMDVNEEEVQVRFRMWGTQEEVQCLDEAPWFDIQPGWRHVAASVRL